VDAAGDRPPRHRRIPDRHPEAREAGDIRRVASHRLTSGFGASSTIHSTYDFFLFQNHILEEESETSS
jgi:hypothetical protein